MNKRYTFLGIVGLLGALLMVAYIPYTSIKIETKKTSMFQKTFQECLQIHDKALARIKDELKVPQEKWDLYQEAIKKTIASDDLKGAQTVPANSDSEVPWIINKTKQLLCEYGINLDRVEIKDVNILSVNAEAQQEIDENGKIIHCLEINSKWMSQFPQEMQEAFIRHEIMHLLNYDPIEAGYIVYMLDSLGHSQKECLEHPAMVNYYHQREARADLLGTCNSAILVKALHDHYAQDAKKYANANPAQWLTHPTPATRSHYLAQLLTAMDADQTVLT